MGEQPNAPAAASVDARQQELERRKQWEARAGALLSQEKPGERPKLVDPSAKGISEAAEAAKSLKNLDLHKPARRLLEAILTATPADEKAAQQLALCTYKDEELPPDT